MVSPPRPVKVPSEPRWYLTSPEPCIDFGSRLPSNSRKILRVGLADDVRQHVEPAAVRHADARPRPGAASAAASSTASSSGDGGLAALQREPLLADVLGLQEGLERLGGVEPAQDAQLLLALGLVVAALDPGLDPAALLRVLDVHVLDADGAAVRVAQHAEDVAQLHHRLAGEAADRELALEVPQRQVVRLDVEVRVLALLVLQRVGVGHQVAADPVGVDQLHDPGGLVDLVVVAVVDIRGPADRLVGDAQRLEDLVVEVGLTQQQLVHRPEELAGLRALDHPVVVGRGQRHDLGHAQAGQGLLGGALELGRVLHRADAEDGALTVHQPGHGVDGADAARVGQRAGDAGVVVHRQLALAGPADDVLVGLPEAEEVEGLGLLDGGDDQGALAVWRWRCRSPGRG